MFRFLQGHVLDQLAVLPSGYVHCCVTSPPYWGLRDYKIPSVHWGAIDYAPMPGLPPVHIDAMDCCLGLEKTPEAFVGHIVQVFREVRRVLREDGVLFLNLGDSYANDGKWGGTTGGKHAEALHGENVGRARRLTGLKPKDLIGIPWRVAFALQADGWYLRMDNIWHKPNPMPESVTDRTTKAHEYVFLMSKSDRYFYDAEAVKEPVNGGAHARVKASGPNTQMAVSRAVGRQDSKPNPSRSNIPGVNPKAAPAGSGIKQNESFAAATTQMLSARNKRSVWTIPSSPFKGAHFACFPPKLVEPCILAGTSARGCCAKCGASWVRVMEKAKGAPDSFNGSDFRKGKKFQSASDLTAVGQSERTAESKTIGWKPSCSCNAETAPCVVLDPFLGSGTSAQVALELGRQAIGIDLSSEYAELISQRTNITPGLRLA